MWLLSTGSKVPDHALSQALSHLKANGECPSSCCDSVSCLTESKCLWGEEGKRKALCTEKEYTQAPMKLQLSAFFC